jgi:hypothetical protein
LQDPILKKSTTKKSWWSGSRCRHWVQTTVMQKKKKKRKKSTWNPTFWWCHLSMAIPPWTRPILSHLRN